MRELDSDVLVLVTCLRSFQMERSRWEFAVSPETRQIHDLALQAARRLTQPDEIERLGMAIHQTIVRPR